MVSGIGPKTASTLLKRYGSFENLYEHIGELDAKTALKLANDAEQAALCKKLATIITDAPIHLDQKAAHIDNINYDSIKKSFEAFGFNSLLKRWEAKGVEEKAKQQEAAQEKKKQEQLGLL